MKAHSAFPLFLAILFASPAFADVAGNLSIEGGNITAAVLGQENATSIWHGVHGKTSASSFFQSTVNAVPNNITYLVLNTGSVSCKAGAEVLNVYFSTEPTLYGALRAGNLSQLDAYMNDTRQDGSATFRSTANFTLAGGTAHNVPATTTLSLNGTGFLMGYFQDAAGSFVFLAPVASGQSFNGSPADFQLMLATNGTARTYYAGVDMKCAEANATPSPAPGSNTGGGEIGDAINPGARARFTIEVPVHVGEGKFCMVWVESGIESYPAGSTLTTVLVNTGRDDCNMSNFTFALFLPQLQYNMSSLSFRPQFNSTYGSVVVYNFPNFLPGEEKTITCQLPGWVSPVRLREDYSFFSLFGSAPLPPLNITIEVAHRNCTSNVSCSDWSPCIEGYKVRSCLDRNGCIADSVWMERCGPLDRAEISAVRDQLCAAYPELCRGKKEGQDYFALCPYLLFLLIAAAVIIILSYLRSRSHPHEAETEKAAAQRDGGAEGTPAAGAIAAYGGKAGAGEGAAQQPPGAEPSNKPLPAPHKPEPVLIISPPLHLPPAQKREKPPRRKKKKERLERMHKPRQSGR